MLEQLLASTGHYGVGLFRGLRVRFWYVFFDVINFFSVDVRRFVRYDDDIVFFVVENEQQQTVIMIYAYA